MSLLHHHHLPTIFLLFKSTLNLKTHLPSLTFPTAPFKKHHSTISPICSSSSSSYYSFNDPSKPSKPESSSPQEDDSSETKPSKFVDEWGEKTEAEPEPPSKFSGPDPPGDEANDEWGGVGVKDDGFGNGTPGVDVDDGKSEKLRDLKMALVDTVYGSDFGFRTSTEVRAEALELVSQLEASNPTSAPTECPELLDGNWVLVYTAFSELLPLLATSSLPLLKVEKISQSIDSSSLTIENSTSISSPVASFSFSASAAFEVRSPSRIQVQFKEGAFKPPEIKSSIDLPESVDIFGQKLNLSPVQQILNPLQNVVFGIASAVSGQPPLKVPIPGERTKSWLLTTYLDKDFRISRGDGGGLFVLAKEGSPLLDR